MPEFTPFPKIARLNRDIIVTEKIVAFPSDEGRGTQDMMSRASKAGIEVVVFDVS